MSWDDHECDFGHDDHEDCGWDCDCDFGSSRRHTRPPVNTGSGCVVAIVQMLLIVGAVAAVIVQYIKGFLLFQCLRTMVKKVDLYGHLKIVEISTKKRL